MAFEDGTRIETLSSPRKNGVVVRFETEAGGQKYYIVHLDGESAPRYLSESEIRPVGRKRLPSCRSG